MPSDTGHCLCCGANVAGLWCGEGCRKEWESMGATYAVVRGGVAYLEDTDADGATVRTYTRDI